MCLGSFDNPHIRAPKNWQISGVKYGDFCQCHSCEDVNQSSFQFDFFAKQDGDLLECQTCYLKRVKLNRDITALKQETEQ